jgi:hypothetical protein
VVAVSALSALAGLLGAGLLLPQVLVVGRARSNDAGAGPRLERVAERLAQVTWTIAGGLGVAAYVVAGPGEHAATCTLVVACAAGLAAQLGRARLVHQAPAQVATAPYR